MYQTFTRIARRKLISAFIATTIISFMLAALYILEDLDPVLPYHLGNRVMGWMLVYGAYVGAIVLVYGTAVSLGLEYAHKRWLPESGLLYISLHGLFGLILGMKGMLAAVIYAVVDRWVLNRENKQKKLKLFFLVPIVLYVFLWGALEIISPSEPPFTKADAVEFATSGEGSITEMFPERIGETKTTIGDYQIVRETKAEKFSHEAYLVTFTETWSKNGKNGMTFISYKVGRNQLTLYKSGGDQPPY